jgi:hypothetical protein
MAWTTPKTWSTDEVVIASGTGSLNEQVRDNLNALSVHAHSGSAGDGAASLATVSLGNLNSTTFADQSGDPASVGIVQRNGTALKYHNGTSAVDLTLADQSAGTASLRSLGTSATTAAAGNHTHPATVAVTDLQASAVTLQTEIAGAFAGSGLATSQTGITVPASGDEDTILTYSWTPSTASNCFISVAVGGKGMITYYNGSNSGTLTLADASATVTYRMKVAGVTHEVMTGISTASAGVANFDPFKTSSTSAQSVTVTVEFTATSSPSQVTDTDGSGNATTATYWSNCVNQLQAGWNIKQLVVSV